MGCDDRVGSIGGLVCTEPETAQLGGTLYVASLLVRASHVKMYDMIITPTKPCDDGWRSRQLGGHATRRLVGQILQ